MNWKTNIKTKTLELLSTSKEFITFLITRAKNDAVTRVASSLSYTSLIALVPSFAIALAIFSAFPVFDNIRKELLDSLIASLAPSMSNEITQYFDAFIKATAKLTTFGVVGIAVTAVMLLSTIENSLNFIFKVTQARRFSTKVTLYWTVITLGPLLLGAGFSMRGYLFTLEKFMSDNIGGVSHLFALVPSLITIVVLMAIYILVPNKKVGIVNSFWGALTCVILFALLRSSLGAIFLSGSTYKTLYGAMATLPIFLVWMYLNWTIIIFGAVVTAALDEFQNREGKILKKNKK